MEDEGEAKATATEDMDDLFLAHRYRLSLVPPRQSSFRVVALIFYQRDEDLLIAGTAAPGHTIVPRISEGRANGKSPQRRYVVGTNDEPCSISGSICAERAAMLQLRFVPNLSSITKLVIVTDAEGFISPGLLCREFLFSHLLIDPDSMPVVLGGSVCAHSGYDISGHSTGLETLKELLSVNHSKRHDFRRVRTTLRELYPHPSPYTRLSSREAMEEGQRHTTRNSGASGRVMKCRSSLMVRPNGMTAEEAMRLLLRLAIQASARDDRPELHPIKYGAAVLFSDGSTASAHHKKALEYGCSLDAVGQLAQTVEDKCTPSSSADSAVNILRTLIRPILLLQCDQYGVIHAPFAVGRAYLQEHGFGDCLVVVQDRHISDDGCHECVLFVKANELAPSTPAVWARD